MTVNTFSLNRNIRKRQAGYTLIELSISLAIIAVLLVGTLTGVQRLLRSNNANNTVSTTQSAMTYITKLYAASGSNSIYTTTQLAQMGVWDSTVVTLTGTGAAQTATVKNPFGGSINVYSNTAAVGTGTTAAATGTGFWYRLGGIPSESCASVATSFINTAAAIYVSSAATTTGIVPIAANSAYKVPGTATSTPNLATSCASAGTLEVSLFIPS